MCQFEATCCIDRHNGPETAHHNAGTRTTAAKMQEYCARDGPHNSTLRQLSGMQCLGPHPRHDKLPETGCVSISINMSTVVTSIRSVHPTLGRHRCNWIVKTNLIFMRNPPPSPQCLPSPATTASSSTCPACSSDRIGTAYPQTSLGRLLQPPPQDRRAAGALASD